MRPNSIGFGTARLHHLIGSKRQCAVLEMALQSGFSHFDSSPIYGDGLAEHRIGELGLARVDQVTLATKIGLHNPRKPKRGAWGLRVGRAMDRMRGRRNLFDRDYSLESCKRSLDASMRRLRAQRIDLLFLHEPSIDLNEIEPLLPWLIAQKEWGRVGRLGLAGDLGACRRIMRGFSGVFSAIQCSAQHLAECKLLEERLDYFVFGLHRAHVNPDGLRIKIMRSGATVLMSSHRSDRIAKFADKWKR